MIVRSSRWMLCFLAVVVLGACARAQDSATKESQDAAIATADLPDSPGALVASVPESFDPAIGSTERTQPAKKYRRTVHPDQIAGPLSAGDKIELSLLSRFTFTDLASTALASGISQARQTRPHYGSDSGAYGERLGAAALKQTTQSLFSYGIFAAAFHDDPRYYIKGRDYSVGRRALYAATRLVVTRKDDGTAVANWPKLLGAASSNALTNAYYPQEDRGAQNFGKLFGASMYGAVINNEVHEFLGDIVHSIFHKK